MTGQPDAAGRTVRFLPWAATWVGIYELANLGALLLNALAVATNVGGVAEDAHVTDVRRYVLEQDIAFLIPPTLVALLIPALFAVGILWLARRITKIGFRILSLVVFLAWAPIEVLFWGTEYTPVLWLAATVTVAFTIRQPRP